MGYFAFILLTHYFSSKESHVNNDDSVTGAMRDLNDNMVVTESPKVYTTLLDIPKLPAIALHRLHHLLSQAHPCLTFSFAASLSSHS